MADVVLFHHAHGLTEGVRDFAETLRREGHTVNVPDLYEGCVFDELEEGVRYAEEIGFGTIIDRGAAATNALPNELVYAGFSLGVLPAQNLAQTRPGARGALLFYSCLPPSEFGGPWPDDVPAQIHIMEHDPFALEGDLDAARELAAATSAAELFIYPGDDHLFADTRLPSYDKEAAELLMVRVLAFLEGLR